MRRTKIVCTVGPASESAEMLRKLAEAGTDVFRLNFSHGTVAGHQSIARRIRTVAEEMEKPVAILQDLPGPKIRLGFSKMAQSSSMREIASASQPTMFPAIVTAHQSIIPNFPTK
jgi:pyruvate kinase